ncbi:electron transfer flavoprotein subunit beta/FixA family protein [Desulfatirhabdium butyrativorans]|uniref:electron transfer flavoprotein subunit beta/FixA family protein n=1 Tax=Desulfatirhabdium butyrativorans TaxID=340467 RepID=UPI000484CDFF|nr:electron transfer flavoprotein subunit beta/FixA family protein [Desulfatirhabdium butyrativorans]
MNIVVLLKQVPSTDSHIEPGPNGASIKTADLKWVINPYDEFAVEEAIRVREAKGGTVTIVTIGEAKAVEAVRTALAMGADKAVLVQDPACAGMDGLGIAQVLAAVVSGLAPDLIIAGQRAVDDENWLVPAAVAHRLGMPCISLVIGQQIDGDQIECRRTIEGGIATIRAKLPVLITTQRGLNEPRYASLQGVMKAKKKPLNTLKLSDLGLTPKTAAVRVLAMKHPPMRTAGKKIAGSTPAEKAAELVRLLHEEAKAI